MDIVIPAWLTSRYAQVRSGSRGALRRLRAVVLIPFAIVAIGASSAPLPTYVAGVAVEDGTLFVAWSSENSGPRWAASNDGSHFAWIQLEEEPKLVSEACVPSTPSVCFRISPDAGQMRMSADGGVTWTIDRRWVTNQGYDPSFRPGVVASLAVVEDGEGYRVYATAFEDGVGVRGSDGAWSFIGTEGGADGLLTPPRYASTSLITIAYSLAVGVCAALVAALILSLVARVRGDWDFGRVAAILSVAIGVFLVCVLAAFAVPEESASWNWRADTTTLNAADAIIGAFAAVMFTAIAGRRAIPVDRRDRRTILGLSVLVGLVAGVARCVPLPVDVSSSARITVVAAATVVTLAAAITLGLRREMRRRAEETAEAAG